MLPNDLSQFAWQIPETKDGFVWSRVTGGFAKSWDALDPMGDWQLLPRPGVGFRAYAPFGSSLALYRILSEVEPSQEGILAFVNRYGRLGKGVQALALVPHSADVAESFDLWSRCLFWLREAVAVWDLISKSAVSSLAKIIKTQGGMVFHVKRPPGDEEITPEMARWSGVIASTVSLPQSIRSKNLPALATFWLHTLLARSMADLVILESSWDPALQRMVLRQTPESLLGAIYLQFAIATQGDRPVRHCEGCGRWFELAPGKNRADRLTCSSSCRTKVYLRRREQARELHASGKKVKQSAAEVGSDIHTVNKWITKEKEEHHVS